MKDKKQKALQALIDLATRLILQAPDIGKIIDISPDLIGFIQQLLQ